MKHVLQIAQGHLKGIQLEIKEGQTLLGRDEECDLMVDHESVSRQHAEFTREGDSVSLRDLGALNKVHVNRKQVMEQVLSDGDHVMIGQVEFHYFMTVEGSGPVFDPHHRLWSTIDITALGGMAVLFLVQALFIIILTTYWNPRTAMAVLEEEAPEPEVTQTNAVAAAATAGTVPPAPPPAAGVAKAPADQSAKAKPKPKPKPKPTPEVAKVPDEEAEVLLSKSRAERMLEQALVLRDERRILGEAERQFKRIQQMDPNFLAAYVELAKLYELRGLEDQAKGQWQQVVKRGRNSPLYSEASEALKKIERNEKMAAYARNFSRKAPPIPNDTTPPSQQPDPLRTAAPPPQPVRETTIKVRAADVKRYPAGDTYDEMRLLNVTLEVKMGQGQTSLSGQDVKVRVKFYDQDQNSLRILPSEVLIAQPEAALEGTVNSGDTPAVTFSYVVQRGYRAVEEQRTGKSLAYYGYIVEVLYQGKRMDSWVMPSALKKFNR